MINNELLEKAQCLHLKYQTEGVYKEELETMMDELQHYVDNLPTKGEEPSEEEKIFIDRLFIAQLELIRDNGMMNEGYILKPELLPNYRLHFYCKDKENLDDYKTLCTCIESIKKDINING